MQALFLVRQAWRLSGIESMERTDVGRIVFDNGDYNAGGKPWYVV